MKVSNKWTILLGIFLVCGFVGYYYLGGKRQTKNWQYVKVDTAPIRVTVPASGTIEPKNHITIMAPVNGRVDKLLYREGESVQKGAIVAWMSSADRAALLDMAKAQGAAAVKKWEREFRPTPIVTPATGVVIQTRVVPGQTVTTQTNLLEISDKLIVRAEVDETDIAQVKIGQSVEVNVDAFAESSFSGVVEHIAHKSKMSNNVTMYEVEITPNELDARIRAGMTANVKFIVEEKMNANVLPTFLASGFEDSEIELFVKNEDGEPKTRKVRVGKSNGDVVEILEGLSLNDVVMYLPVNFLNNVKSPLGLFQKK